MLRLRLDGILAKGEVTLLLLLPLCDGSRLTLCKTAADSTGLLHTEVEGGVPGTRRRLALSRRGSQIVPHAFSAPRHVQMPLGRDLLLALVLIAETLLHISVEHRVYTGNGLPHHLAAQTKRVAAAPARGKRRAVKSLAPEQNWEMNHRRTAAENRCGRLLKRAVHRRHRTSISDQGSHMPRRS